MFYQYKNPEKRDKIYELFTLMKFLPLQILPLQLVCSEDILKGSSRLINHFGMLMMILKASFNLVTLQC